MRFSQPFQANRLDSFGQPQESGLDFSGKRRDFIVHDVVERLDPPGYQAEDSFAPGKL